MRYLIIGLLSLFSIQVLSQQAPEYREKTYSNGKLMYKGYFKNGKPIGEFIRYYSTGVMKAKMNYNTQNVRAKLYNERGVLIAVGKYIGGKKDSIWTYYKRGKIISRDSYLNGMKHGLSVVYGDEGNLCEENNWYKGSKNGIWRRYYSDGHKKFEATYKNSKLDGKFIAYSREGNVDTEGVYSDNVKNGEWKYYDYLGAIRLKLVYINGKSNKDLDEKSTSFLEEKAKSEREFIDPEKNPDEYLMKLRNGR